MSNRGGNNNNGSNNRSNNESNTRSNNVSNNGSNSWSVNAWESEEELLNAINDHLAGGGGINDSDPKGRTFLHDAAVQGYLRAAALLIEKEANIDVEANAEETPLHYAVISNQPEMVRFLVEKGADKNKKTDYGSSPLHLAVEEENREMVKLLLDLGVSAEITNADELTPLQMLCETKKPNLEILETLVEGGANVDAEYPEKIGLTPLHYAVKEGKAPLVSKLLSLNANKEARLTSDFEKLREHYDAPYVDRKHRSIFKNTTPFLVAVILDRPQIVKILLDAGVDKNAELVFPASSFAPELHKNAIHLAIESSNMIGRAEKARTLGLLIDAGVKPILWGGDTPLMYAVVRSREPAVRMLVRKGFDIDEINADNTKTALSYAIVMSMPHMTDVLFELGASIYPKLRQPDGQMRSLADLARLRRLSPRDNYRILRIDRSDPDGELKYRRKVAFKRRSHALASWTWLREPATAAVAPAAAGAAAASMRRSKSRKAHNARKTRRTRKH